MPSFSLFRDPRAFFFNSSGLFPDGQSHSGGQQPPDILRLPLKELRCVTWSRDNAPGTSFADGGEQPDRYRNGAAENPAFNLAR
jgi:hypothetical protein